MRDVFGLALVAEEAGQVATERRHSGAVEGGSVGSVGCGFSHGDGIDRARGRRHGAGLTDEGGVDTHGCP